MAIPKGMFAVATILQEQVPWAAGSFSPHPHSHFFAVIIFACCVLHVPRDLVYWNKRADDRGGRPTARRYRHAASSYQAEMILVLQRLGPRGFDRGQADRGKALPDRSQPVRAAPVRISI